MSTCPKVSVIMNCFNSERHLQEAFASVMAQTFQDFEIIFWDNCSTDSSADIAKSYGEKVRYFRGQETVPLGAGRNLAITQAQGEYIAFLDCDDLWLPTKLEKQVSVLDTNSRVGLVTTDTIVFNNQRELRKLFKNARPERGMVFSALVERQWISMSSAMVRREALASLTPDPTAWNGGWFDESLNVCEEADVFYRIAYAWEVDYVDEPLTRWRVHDQNTTFKKFAQFATETRYILAKLQKIYPDFNQNYAPLVHLLTRRADFEEAVALWQQGEAQKARRLLAHYPLLDKKITAFRLLSFLPESYFQRLATLYFSLPKCFHFK